MTYPIAVTMGDPAGIGPEICLELCRGEFSAASPVPLIFGDSRILNMVAETLELDYRLPGMRLGDFQDDPQGIDAPTVIECWSHDDASWEELEPGNVDAHTGLASFRYVEAAIDCALDGLVAAVATGPIHKEAWHQAGIMYPGHTELFAERTAAGPTCMMLTSNELTCSLVTTHIGLGEVASSIRAERVLEVIELTAQAVGELCGRPPRLAVCGLNPHAGEGGLFGTGEEARLIVPAIEQARQRGLDVAGPLAPDTAFVPRMRAHFDAYVCMYHDQGLIPLKTLAFDHAVNTTLGLPVVRTSVDHGTALDIAWQGVADATSLKCAFDLAVRLVAARQAG